MFFATLFICIISACKKSPVQTIEASWKQVELSGDAKIIFNAVTDGQNLYCNGAYAISVIDTSEKVAGMILPFTSLDRNPVNSKYFISFSGNKKWFIINSYKQMFSSYGGRAFASEVDSSIKEFNIVDQTLADRAGINDRAQVLISARASGEKYKFYMVNFNVTGDGYIATLPSSVKKIEVLSFLNPPNRVFSFDNYFFVGDDERNVLYKIDTAGMIVSIVSPYWQSEMFKYKEKLYLVHGTSIRTSIDMGSTFTQSNNYDADLSGFYFRVVNEQLFVFKPHEGIGIFEFTTSGFKIDMIKNKGLENTHITSIDYFNKRVYASTLTGLYYLNWKDIVK